MFYAIVGLLVLSLIAAALYLLLQNRELGIQIAALRKAIDEQDASHAVEVRGLRSELAKLERLSHIPGVIEKAKRTELEIADKLEQANKRAEEIILKATQEASSLKEQILGELKPIQPRRRKPSSWPSCRRTTSLRRPRNAPRKSPHRLARKRRRRPRSWSKH